MSRSPVAIAFFLGVIGLTLLITYWAAKRTQTADEFYTGGGGLGGFKNGLAIAGDFMSAATFLGISGLIYGFGYDGFIYLVSPMVGLCLGLYLIAEPLRNLGRYTVADVASLRLDDRSIRTFSAVASLAICIMYLVAQMVGAGALMQVLLGIPYKYSVLLVGMLMTIYVGFGGMMATTWVQLTKAAILIFGVTVMAVLVLSQFGFSFRELYDQAANVHRLGDELFLPGGLFKDPISLVSISLALVFGLMGLPHILMRLFTVPNARESQRSVLWAAFFIALVNAMIYFVIGYGGIVLLDGQGQYFDAAGQVVGGGNMVAIHLAEVVGGEAFLGFIVAAAFATILAVVSGLTLAGASAVSHDLYAGVFRRGKITAAEEMRVSRLATIALGIAGISLGLLFEKQNIAYLASLVFAISASTMFPLLMLTLRWRPLSTTGALVGGVLGLISSVGLTVLGPAVWVQILGNATPVFPYSNPAIVSMPLAFGSMILVSLLDRGDRAAAERRAFDHLTLQAMFGTRLLR